MDYSFGLVRISMALDHLPDIQFALKEMLFVVKPGGWIIVNELFSDNLNLAQKVHKMFHHFRSKIDSLTGTFHQETFEKEQILQMVKMEEIQIQFSFENKTEPNFFSKVGELELRIEKMKQHLEKITDRPEYETLKPKIDKFRERALKHGFQPATRIVEVGC